MLPAFNPGLLILIILVWSGYFLPASIWNPGGVRAVMAQESKETGKWYVVTRAFMLKQAADVIRKRLLERGYDPGLIVKKENVSLYAFDDKREFRQYRQAELASAEWKKHAVKAAIISDDSGFRLSLGRYLIAGYAREFEKRLELTGIAFTLRMQETKIPTYRYLFQFLSRQEAEKHWQAVKEIGATDPVLMDEKLMQLMFGKLHSAD